MSPLGLLIANAEHPRVRGENGADNAAALTTAGTSPRARGKHAVLRSRLGVIRNIPACAGKTMSPLGLLIANAEHPRVRGENL